MLKPDIQLFAEPADGVPAEPAEPTTGGKTYSQDYVSTLRNESKNYRIRAAASENALRSLFGLKEGEELGDLNARMTAYRQAQEQAQNDALEKVNGRLISSAINTMDGYDTKLLAMYIDAHTIITAGSVLAAATAIFALVFKIYRWVLKQDKQDAEIKRMKEENTLICFSLSACLDGLMQLGANHSVPVAKEKLDKYLNQTAHK